MLVARSGTGAGITVDSVTFPNGDVGIGATPATDLHLLRSAADAIFRIEQDGNGNTSGIEFTRERFSASSVTGGTIWMNSDTAVNDAELVINVNTAVSAGDSTMSAGLEISTADGIHFWTEGIERVRMDEFGNFLIAISARANALAGGIAMLNGTAEDTALANGISIWASNDGASLSKFVVMGEGLTKYSIGEGGADENVIVGGSILEAADFGATTRSTTGVLKTYSMPANLLNQTDKGIKITAWGLRTGSAATIDLEFRFGTTPSNRVTTTIATGEDRWSIIVHIFRNSATSVEMLILRFLESRANQDVTVGTVIAGINLSLAQTVDFNVSSINAADSITQNGLLIELLN